MLFLLQLVWKYDTTNIYFLRPGHILFFSSLIQSLLSRKNDTIILKKKRTFFSNWMKYFHQASLHEPSFWKQSSIIIKSKIYFTYKTCCSYTTKVFLVHTTQIYLPWYKTTNIDIIWHCSYHKGLLVSNVRNWDWKALHIYNQLVNPAFTWVKCTKFKLSVSIYFIYQWIFLR